MVLGSLGVLFCDIVPHAADIERTFSMMGWYHSDIRNRMSAATTTAMTTIRTFYKQRTPGGGKGFREAEAVTLPLPEGAAAGAAEAAEAVQPDADLPEESAEPALEPSVPATTVLERFFLSGKSEIANGKLVVSFNDLMLLDDFDLTAAALTAHCIAPPPRPPQQLGQFAAEEEWDPAQLVAAQAQGAHL